MTNRRKRRKHGLITADERRESVSSMTQTKLLKNLSVNSGKH